MDNAEVATKVRGGYRLPNPDTLGYECDSVMYGTMRDCWSSDPADRPTFRELWFVFEEHLEQNNDIYAELD